MTVPLASTTAKSGLTTPIAAHAKLVPVGAAFDGIRSAATRAWRSPAPVARCAIAKTHWPSPGTSRACVTQRTAATATKSLGNATSPGPLLSFVTAGSVAEAGHCPGTSTVTFAADPDEAVTLAGEDDRPAPAPTPVPPPWITCCEPQPAAHNALIRTVPNTIARLIRIEGPPP
jgi:hypothetical protein